MPRVLGPTSIDPIPAELPVPCRTALQLLLQAHDYAADLSLSSWDFALEITNLRHAGVSNSDLRWLTCKGCVEHAHEHSTPAKTTRQFLPSAELILSERSCFVLTPVGLVLARALSSSGPLPSHAEASRVAVPKYNADLRELTLDGELVKRFTVPAPNQELILRAFEEEGWPPHLDDPLPPRLECDPKGRLHDAIYCLNRNQKRRLLKFSGSGDGLGLRWQRLSAE